MSVSEAPLLGIYLALRKNESLRLGYTAHNVHFRYTLSMLLEGSDRKVLGRFQNRKPLWKRVKP